MQKLKMKSKNLVKENMEKIGVFFPNVITETEDEEGNITKAIDFELLQQELSDEIVEGNKERYQLTWPGKKEAIVAANTPIDKTLRPVKEDSLNWNTTENLYIEGDNLEVLKLLQESYLGKIKCIYIDPPYNTGNDFIYKDSFVQDKDEYLEESGQVDEEGNRLFLNTEYNGRYHSDWLTMMYPRLKLARNLLSEDGVIFISIDDNEVHNLRKICDEIFGEGNFIGIFTVNSTPNARDYGHIGKMHDYIVFYAKNVEITETSMLIDENKAFKYVDKYGEFNIHPLYNSNVAFTPENRPNLYYPFYLHLGKKIDDDFYKIGLHREEDSVEIYPPKSVKDKVQFVWRWGKEKSRKNLNKEVVGYRTGQGEYRIVQKMRGTNKIIRSILSDRVFTSRKGTAEVEGIFGKKIYSFPKPIELIKTLVYVGTNKTSNILDFFSGSATTAHAVMELNAKDGGNRKYIMIQLPEPTDEKSEAYKAGYENISEIGKERIRRAGKKIKEETGADIDYGFRVYKVDSTNMKDVYYRPDELAQKMLEHLESNIKEDRTGIDLLTQVMLETGLELSLPMETEEIRGKEVYFVAGNSLVACFDENIDEELIKGIAEIEPLRAVFRDNSFKSCQDKINLEEIFKGISPNTDIRVL